MRRYGVDRFFRVAAAGLALSSGAALAAGTPGEAAWRSETGFYLTPESGQTAPAPTLTATGEVATTASSTAGEHRIALFSADGSGLWSVAAPSLGYGDPESFYPPRTTADGHLVAATSGNHLMVLDGDGNQVEAFTWNNYRGVVASDDGSRLFTYVKDIYSITGDVLYANAVAAGGWGRLWAYPLSDFENGLSAHYKPGLLHRDDTLYLLVAPLVATDTAGAYQQRACLVAIDAARGERRWQWCNESGAPNSVPVADASGNLYFSDATKLHSLSAQGELRWSVEVTGGALQPGVAADGTLFVNSESAAVGGVKYLHALNGDGTPRWQLTFEYAEGIGSERTTPLFSQDGTVYFTNVRQRYDAALRRYVSDATLSAVDAAGALLWEYRSGEEGAPSSPTLDAERGLVYFTVTNGSLHAVNVGGIEVMEQCPTFADGVLTIPCVADYGVGARLALESAAPLTFTLQSLTEEAAGVCATLQGARLMLPCVEGYDVAAELTWGNDQRFRLTAVTPRQ